MGCDTMVRIKFSGYRRRRIQFLSGIGFIAVLRSGVALVHVFEFISAKFMRRFVIAFYWFFKSGNNVGFIELIKFLLKPTVSKIASRYIKTIEENSDWVVVSFNQMDRKLFWPKEYPVSGIYQVVSETFDHQDWHFYQKKGTLISDGEVLLDIGAAEALFSLSVLDKCEKIILIEPNDHFARSLEKTFDGFFDKVKIICTAVGNRDGEISFNLDSLSGKISEEANQNKKPITTIDRLLLDEPKITYLKADLEGFELQMLQGAEKVIKKHKPKIAITSYHIENDANQIISLIKSYVPTYNYYVKGINHVGGKPVMIHFWL
jgi:FkbM family methyltransferase